ncbi:uncharacterized protein [Syngnathus scovelli]|uniref:uncharacterized protein n=1 Tax=Syngnathus scovelli TaxID=161590 RepID=UPI00210F96FD|nr:uncharacterized protein LOC125986046 [Syngnathus scovelli]
MGASCCCRPKSPCGSFEERSGLLKDDAKAIGPAGHLAVTADGTCGPQGDEGIRMMTDTVTLKVEDTDNLQAKLLPEFDASEPIAALENGSLMGEAASNKTADNATLDEGAIGEESLEMFLDAKGTSDLGSEADRQWQDGDRGPASSMQVLNLDDGPQEARLHADVCRHNNEGEVGSKVASGCMLPTELCWKHEDPPSSVDSQEASVAAECHENTPEPDCLVTEDSKDGDRSALMSGQAEESLDAPAEPTEATGGGDEGRPAHFNHVAETLTATPEDADSSQPAKQNQQDGLDLLAGDDQDGGHPAVAEGDDVEITELTEQAPQILAQESTAIKGGLRSSEEDLYRGEEELPPSPDDTQAAPFESCALEARCSLGPAVDILSYGEREWRGNTTKSALIKKGYAELSLHFAGLRQVRGDNYCALRATLFQVLSQASQVPVWLQEDNDEDDDVTTLSQDLTAQWRFPGEAEAQPDVTQRLQSYLEILRNKWCTAAHCSSDVERRQLCEDSFRGGEEEVAILEALKLLMLRRACQLHAGMHGDHDVPLFCWLLFARDSSRCPRDFFANHLSRVGISAGLEQVEMCLLGDALRCTLQVYRLYMADTEEFVSYYPDEHKDEWPRVSLVTEDDRHYNVPVASVDREDNEETEEERAAS